MKAPHQAEAPRQRGAVAVLEALARKAERLPPPCHRQPEAFHEHRSELAAELRAVARIFAGRRRP